MVKHVFVENENASGLVSVMFLEQGWAVVTNPKHADLMCFTGGHDVMPALYGHAQSSLTRPNPYRDQACVDLWNEVNEDIPLVGICRGAQFLNVMEGGYLYQHVEGHTATHKATMVHSGEEVDVTSTHHQMMIPAPEGEVLMTASCSSGGKVLMGAVDAGLPELDTEAIFYESGGGVLCFQPHPEYVQPDEDTQRIFFSLLKEYLEV